MESEKNKGLDCREFIGISAKGAAGISLASLTVLSGCADSEKAKTVFGACYHDCPDRCSWTVSSLNNKITDFQANKNDPYTAGNLCNRMVNFPNDVTFHPDRILSPLKRNILL